MSEFHEDQKNFMSENMGYITELMVHGTAIKITATLGCSTMSGSRL